MYILFRTDASLQIGTGHVMRSLTLADAMAAKGAHCEFICRNHSGHLMEHIRSKGYTAHSLPMCSDTDTDLAHSNWLGATQAQDAYACAPILAARRPDWLVVDHYALDARWESTLAPHCGQVMVIDDLADRPHACQILLDQTFGRAAVDYCPLVPGDCALLCGSNYALLRPEFASLRPYSLERRVAPKLKQLLVTMGGVDKDNITSKVLAALHNCPLPHDCEITVVMGATAPWLDEVCKQAQDMPWTTRVLVGVRDMGQLMADSDLAIGAAGSTSWEFCCLGVPNLLVCTAANQRTVIAALDSASATVKLDRVELSQPDGIHFCSKLTGVIDNLKAYAAGAARVTDGAGASRVRAELAWLP